MRAIAGPPRYYFLRRPRGAREETSYWPPDVKPMDAPENLIGVAVRLTPEEIGWRAEIVPDEAGLHTPGQEGSFLLSRDTTLGLAPDGKSGAEGIGLALLGVRVINADNKGVEYASHLVVRITGGIPFGAPNTPFVAPIETLLLSEYVEHNARDKGRAQAALDLRLTRGQLLSLPVYLPDPVIGRYVTRTIDETVLAQQARHSITFEVEAGRVSLYGRPELESIGEELRAALVHTTGVVDIADHMIYGVELDRQVEEALAKANLGDVEALYEHGLVVLRGMVPTNAARHKAKEVVLRIPGVRGVVNDLKVAEAPASAPVAPANTTVAQDNAETTNAAKNNASNTVVPNEQAATAAAETANAADGAQVTQATEDTQKTEGVQEQETGETASPSEAEAIEAAEQAEEHTLESSSETADSEAVAQ